MSAPESSGTAHFTAFLVAGEESGDALGAALMAALTARLGAEIRFVGVGGARMTEAGLRPIFPMGDLSLHGVTEVLARLPKLVSRLRETALAVLAARPDVLVLIDAPAFNLRLARRVRRRQPAIPIVDYVSPTVWAHNAWRARKMAPNVDQIVAILPFEPEVHRQLGGPLCVYVGHPLLERLPALRPAAGERRPVAGGGAPTLLVLPGSRRSEIARLMEPFGETIALIKQQRPDVEVILPAVERLRDEIAERAAAWPVRPVIVAGEEAKLAAFRRAHAALAASGTVTLELALAGVPMVVAYRVDLLLRPFKRFLRTPSIVLANIVLGEKAVPEFLDGASTPERLAGAVLPLLRDSPERAAQVLAFAHLEAVMQPNEGTPADLAATAVLEAVRRRATARTVR